MITGYASAFFNSSYTWLSDETKFDAVIKISSFQRDESSMWKQKGKQSLFLWTTLHYLAIAWHSCESANDIYQRIVGINEEWIFICIR